MKLFAIGDLHLPGGDDKPMDVFGEQWTDHFERIARDWRARVSPEDVVLIPGDVSWAMQLSAALPDLAAIAALPGRKVLSKGNHEYWWSSVTQVRAALPAGMYAIQHDALDLGEAVVCGTRGWIFPGGDAPLTPEDEKIYRRELGRLRMALDEAAKRTDGRPLVVMLHYPPLYAQGRASGFSELIEAYPVHTVVYGHLHGAAIRTGFNGVHGGVRYRLTSCDSLGFCLAELSLAETAGEKS